MTAGVYRIRNRVTGVAYVGSSVDIQHRIKWHIARMKCGMHENRRLRGDWKLYGSAAFSFSVLEVTDPDNETLARAEQRWMTIVSMQSKGMYNVHLNSRIGRRDMQYKHVGQWRALEHVAAELAAERESAGHPEGPDAT